MYTRRFNITDYDVGADEIVRVSSLLKYFQTIATDDLDRQGMSYEFLRSHNMAFVLTKYSVRVYSKMHARSEYDFITSPCLVNGPTFIRDFTVCDTQGVRVAVASSEWVLIDFQSRRLLRPSALPGTIKNDGKIHDFYPSRTFVQEDFEFEYSLAVTHSMLDENRHLNNCNYFNVIYDGFYANHKSVSPVADIEINFAHEAVLDDKLSLKYHFDGKDYHISCHNLTKENVCFTASLHDNIPFFSL